MLKPENTLSIRRQIVDTSVKIVNRPPNLELERGDRRLEYLHVPKCGGTTVRYVLEAYAQRRDVPSFNEGRSEAEKRFSRAEARISMGHEPVADQYQRTDTLYVTILRDPIERLRSHLAMFARYNQCDLEDALSHFDPLHFNSACYTLAGPNVSSNADAQLDAAKLALEKHLHVFGFQEQHSEAMALLSAVLDVDGLIYPGFQYGSKRGALRDSTLDYERLAELCRHDQQLDTFARDLYASRWAPVFEKFSLHEKRYGPRYLTIQMDTGMPRVVTSETVFRKPDAIE